MNPTNIGLYSITYTFKVDGNYITITFVPDGKRKSLVTVFLNLKTIVLNTPVKRLPTTKNAWQYVFSILPGLDLIKQVNIKPELVNNLQEMQQEIKKTYLGDKTS